ncbi:MAG: methylamine methyltransferase corrinoid protein reductive activase [Methermicoccaceae archaeon]
MSLGIALDLGTSGFRGQAIDLDTNKTVSTTITLRHPIPGANVMDHLHFCIDVGEDVANGLVITAINKIIDSLGVDTSKVERIAVCGNPIQLSILENIEIRDLAYAGKKKLEHLGVVPPNRDARTLDAREAGLKVPEKTELLIPPAVRHEIGADALAMMIKTGLLEKEESALVTDYGTNAEMALKVGDDIYTGSAAAGPAIEGQEISSGMLASPGAISDVDVSNGNWRIYALDDDLLPQEGDLIDPHSGKIVEKGYMHDMIKGVTGTGVIAALAHGITQRIIKPPTISTEDGLLHLMGEDVVFTQQDIEAAGEAIGAIRAGHLTLMVEAGIPYDDVETMYMTGASGTYVDAFRAREVGLIPQNIKQCYQVGNTSLSMAADLVRNAEMLDYMQDVANSLRAKHVMFANSQTFKNIYIIELSYWTQGMPFDQYNNMLDMYSLPHISVGTPPSMQVDSVERDIVDIGEKGLSIVEDIGTHMTAILEGCTLCQACVEECPEGALVVEESESEDYAIGTIDTNLCLGTACRRCEAVCPVRTQKLGKYMNVADI